MQALTFDGTRKLYYEDAYETAFTARVISAERAASEDLGENVKNGENAQNAENVLWDVVLDQTLFFPEEGGQSPDKGTLGGFEVVDVQIRDGVITHTVRMPEAFAQDDKVEGRIDWDHRFSNMQQHSGEHLFSGIAHSRFGCVNVGFHLSDSEVTLDFDRPLSDAEVGEIEAAVNDAIVRNIESRVLFPTKDEEAELDYRSKIEISGQVRLVEYPGYDLCACCAPHVRRTGEIGLLKVMMTQNYKGGIRVSILCGKRALEALKKEHRLITGIGRSLSTSPDEIPAQIARFKDEIAALKASLKESQGTLLKLQAESLPSGAPRVILFAETADAKVVRDLINELVKEHREMAAVFTGNDNDGYNFVIGSADNKAQEECAKLREAFQARGGGQPVMVQGSLKAEESAIRTVLE